MADETGTVLDADKLDTLIASVKSVDELVTALSKAVDELKTPPAPGANTFTQEELDEVLGKVDELKTALSTLVTPA